MPGWLTDYYSCCDIEDTKQYNCTTLVNIYLLGFFSFLLNEGRKDEAAKYLRMACAFDPQYDIYWKNFEKYNDNFVGDLANSRRADY